MVLPGPVPPWYFAEDQPVGVELQQWIDTAGRPEGEGFSRADFETHIREEFSTYGWIIEGLLQRAELEVVESEQVSPTHAEYLCRRR